MSFIKIREHTLWAPPLGERSVVVDLGANRGDFAHGMIRRFGCRCHAVEPAPAVHALIPSHARLTTHNLAIGARTGEQLFHISDNPEASSLYKLPTAGYVSQVSVQGRTLDDFLAGLALPHIDVLKLDVEGAEIEILGGCDPAALENVAQLTVEFHHFCGLTPRADVERVIKRLRSLGFYTPGVRLTYADVLLLNRRHIPPGRVRLALLKQRLRMLPSMLLRDWKEAPLPQVSLGG